MTRSGEEEGREVHSYAHGSTTMMMWWEASLTNFTEMINNFAATINSPSFSLDPLAPVVPDLFSAQSPVALDGRSNLVQTTDALLLVLFVHCFCVSMMVSLNNSVLVRHG